MAASTPTPLLRKLGVKTGQRLAFVNPPDGLDELLGPLPLGTITVADWRDESELDFILFFAGQRKAMEAILPNLVPRLAPDGGLWVAWPKKASGVVTDLSDDVVRKSGLAAGLVDNKICSIDATWSGQRFVYRLRDRPRS
jgi:hypothetical protein